MNAKMKDFEMKINSKIKKLSSNSADQEAMALLVEQLTSNIKSETTEMISILSLEVVCQTEFMIRSNQDLSNLKQP